MFLESWCCQQATTYDVQHDRYGHLKTISAPQSIRDEWARQKCNLDNDVKQKTCKKGTIVLNLIFLFLFNLINSKLYYIAIKHMFLYIHCFIILVSCSSDEHCPKWNDGGKGICTGGQCGK